MSSFWSAHCAEKHCGTQSFGQVIASVLFVCVCVVICNTSVPFKTCDTKKNILIYAYFVLLIVELSGVVR